MRSKPTACFAIALLILFAGVSLAGAADKTNPVPPTTVFGDNGKSLPPGPDPNDPNKGQSGSGPLGPPANDLCANAQAVAIPSATPGSTVGATLDSVGTCGTSNTAPGVWYIFTPATTGFYRASTCNAANYDTKISVFSGSCGSLACIGGLDDTSGCAGFSTQFDFPATAGSPVRVLVHGFGAATGTFTLSMSFLGGAPANDDCDAAIPVAVPSTTAGSTNFSAIDNSFPACGTSITAGGVWYEVTGTGNQLRASTCNDAAYDTKLTVYCQDCATPTCIVGVDDTVGCAGFTTQADWETEPGATYRILVHGFSTATGDFNLTVSDLGIPSVNPAPCFGPVGACCDPDTAGCTQTDEYLCTLADGSFAAGLPCFVPIAGQSYTSNPGVAIPDNNTTGVTDTITVTDDFAVGSVTVDVGITHTWIGDLRLQLEHVDSGQIINMWDRRCGSTDNINTTFIDGGQTTLCVEIAVPGGQVDPTVAGLGPAFSSLGGLSSASDWRLTVDDNFPADTGTFNTWTLNFLQSVCYAYPPVQEIPTMDRRGLAALALLLAGAAAFLLWRRRG